VSAIVEASKISKEYRLPNTRPATLKASLMAMMSGHQRAGGERVWALRDVDLSVERGSALGVIGHNGAGKTTLLRLLCGVGRPTRGTLRIDGRTGGVLALGTGFHGDLTGRENVIVGGVLNGMTTQEARRREPEIVRFAELDDVIDHPLRTYSSGMHMRLAFSTALHSDPDVLVIDEVLAVGDARFQKKCLDRLRAFRRGGGTMILASHVLEHVRALCDQVMVLENGRAVAIDDPEAAIDEYESRLDARTDDASAAGTAGRQGSGEAKITAVRALDAAGRATDVVRSRTPAGFEIDYTARAKLEDMSVTLGIFAGAMKCFEIGIPSYRSELGALKRRGRIRCRVSDLPLAAGRYFVVVGLYAPQWERVFDYHWQMHSIEIAPDEGSSPSSGPVAVAAEWVAED
jgi:lipopolysaccharide transport system ATP-binding protein